MFCLLYLFNVIVILLVILVGIGLVSVVYVCFWLFVLLVVWVFVGFELLLIGCLLLICDFCLGLLVIVLHVSLSFLCLL